MNRFSNADVKEYLDQKTIPSKVFFNHFDAISTHLKKFAFETRSLKKIEYYNKLEVKNKDFSLDKCKKLLYNSWSTEYSCGLAQSIDNPDYYKYSLHWNFPQAYYSTYLNMSAFHETQGIASDIHEKSIKTFGNSVSHDHYPKTISFHSTGFYKNFEYKNLDKFEGFPKDFSPLSIKITDKQIQTQIANFLKTTRKKNAEDKRERIRKNDKRFHTKEGGLTKVFRKKHWNYLYETIPVTSILNILYRLRIKANYRDIETFIEADVDFKEFQNSILEIVYNLNFVHEAYIAKCLGEKKYQMIIDGFKNDIIKNTAIKRLDQIRTI